MSETTITPARAWVQRITKWFVISLVCMLVALVLSLFDDSFRILLIAATAWQLAIVVRVMLALGGIFLPKSLRREKK
jgi:hypothetical protein